MKKIQLTTLGVLFLILSANGQNNMERQTGKEQFNSTIVINASIKEVWDVIKDSKKKHRSTPVGRRCASNRKIKIS